MFRGGENTEWLVTDQKGAFAMGTADGVRSRKYHGFYLGIPGRAETAFLTDFELQVDHQRIWPHRYGAGHSSIGSADDMVIDPARVPGFHFESTPRGPTWQFPVSGGTLSFHVRSGRTGHESSGIRLIWKWAGINSIKVRLRPMFAMRPLHENGGRHWQLEKQGELYRVASSHGAHGSSSETSLEGSYDAEEHETTGDDLLSKEIFCAWSAPVQWKTEPLWYRNFFYTEELARGYTATEDLFTGGRFDFVLNPGQEITWRLSTADDELGFENQLKENPKQKGNLKSVAKNVEQSLPENAQALSSLRAGDFVLNEPAGIVAGFPWFGEWGRDTFVSLPGIVVARLESGDSRTEVREWAYEILTRWGEWIERVGMIPNLIEQGGSHQWESADGALWWCHSLASLWALTLDDEELFPDLEKRFTRILSAAIRAISDGRHLFLKKNPQGLLEVTEAHTTWMDAKVDGAAVTPRMGTLPEINALWFQAKILHFLWTGDGDFVEIEKLGHAVLAAKEADRPNSIFLHSLPLAPSFVLQDWESLRADLKNVRRKFLTPVGLRSLSPKSVDYIGHCVGHQRERDQAYHQGSVWGWLAGHYEMAENRSPEVMQGREQPQAESLLGHGEFPISGHVPEIFDGDAPHLPRGAPAQAWSLACSIESQGRKNRQLDRKLTKILAKRWSRTAISAADAPVSDLVTHLERKAFREGRSKT
jgi:glycogen debranching enzyme